MTIEVRKLFEDINRDLQSLAINGKEPLAVTRRWLFCRIFSGLGWLSC